MTPLIVPGLYRSHVFCAWPMWIGAPTSMGPRKSARARVRLGELMSVSRLTVTCLSPSSPPADDRAVVAQTEDQNQSAASAQEAPKPPSLRRHRNATFEHRLPRSSGIIEDLDGSTRMIPSEDENLIRLAV